MNAILIGGGIGGLTAALALRRAGVSCCVYEAAARYKRCGFGINLHPHAVRELAKLGLEESLAGRGVVATDFTFFNAHGQLIHREPCGRAAGHDHPQITIQRADLHEILLEAVGDRLHPQPVIMDHRCAGLWQDPDGVDVRFERLDGARPVDARADLVIGCDGLHSVVRQHLYPWEPPPRYTGHTTWRGVVRAEPFLSGTSITLIGAFKTGMVAVYPIKNFADGTQLLSLTAVTPVAHEASGPAQLEDFIAPFEDWRFDWIDVPKLFSRVQVIHRHPLLERDLIVRWTFGRISLLGDAAHPMSPRGGNGAAQAIIDASVLARCLATRPDAPSALWQYDEERRPVASRIVLASRLQPPDTIIGTVEAATAGRPFADIDRVVDRADLRRISDDYKRVTGALPAQLQPIERPRLS